MTTTNSLVQFMQTNKLMVIIDNSNLEFAFRRTIREPLLTTVSIQFVQLYMKRVTVQLNAQGTELDLALCSVDHHNL